MENVRILILPGNTEPLGVFSPEKDQVNFAFFSPCAEKAELTIFKPGDLRPLITVLLLPSEHKTGAIWHALLTNIQGPFSYSYRLFKNSQWTPPLLDPYAKALSSSSTWGSKEPYKPIAHYFSQQSFDWEQTKKPCTPLKDWIIYEMHVRAFTQHASSHTQSPGTFLGVIEKIPHLKKLGINAIELLPVFEFNECENPNKDPFSEETLYNFWGYSTVNFFTPMKRYASNAEWESSIIDFKTMVRELHKNGIAVILDVVYNHTAELGTIGPILSFKGFDEKAYYSFNSEGDYCNFSGTGNTMNCNHPATLQLIVDSLSYWAHEMQVDGFRFDLASILTRASDGTPLKNPPVLRAMEQEPLLRDTVFIAEAWDAAGLYQVGSFPGGKKWTEWNGQYRDAVRAFIKGSSGKAGIFAKALCGSQDLYWEEGPLRSLNFVTAHDGYSLYDLVSYEHKHNLNNGENNQDGTNQNISWNCGIEGATDNEKILALRERQMKNLTVALFVSLGIPMILMGDEYAHTRKGNNNPYCQDNELNWFLWDKIPQNQQHLLFFQKMISFRKKYSHFFCRETFLSHEDVIWHGVFPNTPDWGAESHIVAYSLKSISKQELLFICFNAKNTPLLVQLPLEKDRSWVRVIDTSLKSPYDFIEDEDKRPFCKKSYLLPPFSTFIAQSHVLYN